MNYKEILDAARDCIGPYCKACPICNGRACANAMPGPGCKAPGNAAARNYDKWQELCVNMDTICENKNADTSVTLFGRQFALPVFAAPVGALQMHYGDKFNDEEYNAILVPACAKAGIAAFTGDGTNPAVFTSAAKAIGENGGKGIPTVKPWDKGTVFAKIDAAKAAGAKVFAMDIDAAGLPFLKGLNPPAGPKTVEELKEIIDYAGVPFIIKGIMTVKGALKALEAGAAGIVPGVLIAAQEEYGFSDREAVCGLLTASAIGGVVATRATISGAAGGCQAEIGSASSMAAGALVYLQGGDCKMIVNAAAMAMKNLLGLVCDPVAGLVEVPCVKRNVIGTVNAMSCADMTMAGIFSRIPPDQVIDAMKEVGDKMDSSLRETALGGLAQTPEGIRIAAQLL